MENKRGLLIWIIGMVVVILVYGSIYFAMRLKEYFPTPEEAPLEIITSEDGHWRLLGRKYGYALLDYRIDSAQAQIHFPKTLPEFISDSTNTYKYITYAEIEIYESGTLIARNIITNQDTMQSYVGNWRIEDKHLVFDNPLFLSFPEKNMLRGFK